MASAETAASTRHGELLAQVNRHIEQRFESNLTKHSLGEAAQEITKDYSEELLEALLVILEESNSFDRMEVIEEINMPRYADLMLPAAKLHQQFKKIGFLLSSDASFLPDTQIGFRRARRYLASLESYADDQRVPAVPEAGYPLHPIHLAIIMVTEATYILTEIAEFNGVDEGIIDWLEGSSYRLVSEELLNYIHAHPENGIRLARVGYLLETMKLGELLPYVDIMEKNPDTEDQITSLLSSGTIRLAQVEAVLNKRVTAPLSAGAL
jgi:hypothetical protein